MGRILCVILFFLYGSAVQADEIADKNESSIAPFPLDASRELLEVWLRFHEEGLCLEIDPVFVSDETSVQVWSLVEDEKSYKKFLRILRPLSQSGRLEVFAAEAVSPEDSDENGAPASLWENDELRKFYSVPRRRSDPELSYDWPLGVVTQEDIFMQRMIIFSRQTIERGENLERLAKDLPVLTRIARDPAFDADLRLLAYEVCLEHTRSLEKQTDKLHKNLKLAIPKGKERQEVPLQDIRSSNEDASPLELAVRISEKAQNISRQVYSFIYPDSHTVGLDELRNPGLLNSLLILQELSEIYMRKMSQEIAGF